MPMLYNLIQDVRYAARTLHRNPAFTTVALLALALGIGANTAVFTIVNSVLLRPLPFREPERLVALSAVPPDVPFLSGPAVPDRVYLEFRAQDHLFEKLAAFNAHQVNLSGAGDAASVQGAFVTADFFAVLRARPALGRTFAPDEDQPGRDKVVVLSDKLWRANFASSPAVIGKSLKLDGVSYTVIGVMPEGFAFPAQLDLWAPNFVHFQEHQSLLLSVIGRLKAGIAARQAAAELDTVIKRIPAEQLGPEGRRREARRGAECARSSHVENRRLRSSAA